MNEVACVDDVALYTDSVIGLPYTWEGVRERQHTKGVPF